MILKALNEAGLEEEIIFLNPLDEEARLPNLKKLKRARAIRDPNYVFKQYLVSESHDALEK